MVLNSVEEPRKLDGYRVLVSLQIGRGITHVNRAKHEVATVCSIVSFLE